MLLQRVRLCLVAFQLVPPRLAPTLFLQDKGTLLRAREKKKTEIISRLLIKLAFVLSLSTRDRLDSFEHSAISFHFFWILR